MELHTFFKNNQSKEEKETSISLSLSNGQILFQNQKIPASKNLNKLPSDNEIKEMKFGTHSVIVRGVISYCDIFKKTHTTKFCLGTDKTNAENGNGNLHFIDGQNSAY